MVGYIISFATIEKARVYGDKLHDDNVIDAISNGYTVIDNEIVGKNAATGLDDLDAQRTTKWNEPLEDIDGTFFLDDESQKPKFSNSLDGITKDYQRKINFIGGGNIKREDGSKMLREDNSAFIREDSKHV